MLPFVPAPAVVSLAVTSTNDPGGTVVFVMICAEVTPFVGAPAGLQVGIVSPVSAIWLAGFETLLIDQSPDPVAKPVFDQLIWRHTGSLNVTVMTSPATVIESNVGFVVSLYV